MPKRDFLKNLASQLCQSFPGHLGTLQKDASKHFHHVLSQAFSKLDLVTREEFDAQTKVLGRTRKKLEELQEEVTKLEKKSHGKRDK